MSTDRSRRTTPRQRKRRRGYERNRGVDARGWYGYTARHIRCDWCLIAYLPQHTHRWVWSWVCGNCLNAEGRGIPVRTGRLYRKLWEWRHDPIREKVA